MFDIGALWSDWRNTPDGGDYESLRVTLAEHGVSLPTPDYLSKCKKIHDWVVIEWDRDPATFAGVGLTKLYMLARAAETRFMDPLDWLEPATTLTRDELHARLHPGEQPEDAGAGEGSEWDDLPLPRGIRERLDAGLQRLYGIVGYEPRGDAPHLAGMEFVTECLERLPADSWLALWRDAHGEEEGAA